EPAHFTLACVLLPPAGNWVRSACPIPPWFVVSFALSMTSTRANWLRSGAFLSPRAPFPTDSFGEGLLIPLFGTRSARVSRPRRSATEGLQVTRRAVNRCEYCRLSQEGQEASFPIDHITPSARGSATEPAHFTLACVLLPPAGNWVRFACQIPPWFVVSFALSMTSTRANWLRSGAF